MVKPSVVLIPEPLAAQDGPSQAEPPYCTVETRKSITKLVKRFVRTRRGQALPQLPYQQNGDVSERVAVVPSAIPGT